MISDMPMRESISGGDLAKLLTNDATDTVVKQIFSNLMAMFHTSPTGFLQDFTTSLILDCRRYADYKVSHVRGAVNICCSKLIRRRFLDNKVR